MGVGVCPLDKGGLSESDRRFGQSLQKSFPRVRKMSGSRLADEMTAVVIIGVHVEVHSVMEWGAER